MYVSAHTLSGKMHPIRNTSEYLPSLRYSVVQSASQYPPLPNTCADRAALSLSQVVRRTIALDFRIPARQQPLAWRCWQSRTRDSREFGQGRCGGSSMSRSRTPPIFAGVGVTGRMCCQYSCAKKQKGRSRTRGWEQGRRLN